MNGYLVHAATQAHFNELRRQAELAHTLREARPQRKRRINLRVVVNRTLRPRRAIGAASTATR